MTIKVNLPKSGMGIDEGTVMRWRVAVGDIVKKGDVIVEVETEKAIQEVEAPASGRLTQVTVHEGDTVPVNTTLALIEDESL